MSNASADKYKSLVSNTVIFGISTFGSKVLVVLLTRLWTELLDPDAMAVAELVSITCNLILPVMYLCIAESVIRFGLEKDRKRSDIFSVGIFTVLGGYGVLWACYPLVSRIPAITEYTWLVYLYCLTSAMRTVITSYVRTTGLVRLFAIDGIVTTATTLTFNLVFMVGFKLGPVGYVLGTVVADGLSALSLFFLLRLYRFLRVRGIDPVTRMDMFRYALPLIPNAVAWWITNLSDRYFVLYMVSQADSGIYSKAQTIPNLIIQVSTFFTRAWELSAFSEYNSKEGERFFSTVFRSYYTLVFVTASGLILLIQPLTKIMLAKTYYEAWRYSVFLILGVSFSCLVTFLGAIYNANKKNGMITVTTIIGAVVNITLNAVLIPIYDVQGAAIATFVSYFVVFVIRAVDTQRYMRIHMQPWRMALSLLLLLGQAAAILGQKPFWLVWELLCFVLLVLINFGYLLYFLKRLLAVMRRRRSAG